MTAKTEGTLRTPDNIGLVSGEVSIVPGLAPSFVRRPQISQRPENPTKIRLHAHTFSQNRLEFGYFNKQGYAIGLPVKMKFFAAVFVVVTAAAKAAELRGSVGKIHSRQLTGMGTEMGQPEMGTPTGTSVPGMGAPASAMVCDINPNLSQPQKQPSQCPATQILRLLRLQGQPT